ncbi:hypothetical protein MBENS4_0541 [Novosphingobium sp. MBES04]|nr:hypothetical protein MBENS4_0541 [Novosphingobium sp. MBES04]
MQHTDHHQMAIRARRCFGQFLEKECVTPFGGSMFEQFAHLIDDKQGADSALGFGDEALDRSTPLLDARFIERGSKDRRRI